MTYLDYINKFERTCEQVKVASNAQVLYYKLLHIANVTGWPDWISVDNLRLMLFSDISSQGTLRRARDELVSLGVIEYQKGKKNQPCKYRLVSKIDTKTNTMTDTMANTMTDTMVNTKMDTIIRYKTKTETKTKKNTANAVKEIADLFNSVCVSLPRVRSVSGTRLQKAKARLQSFTYEDMAEVFKKAEDSDFLSGRSGEWRASFDWIMNSDSNITKILEGNYDNRQPEVSKNGSTRTNAEIIERAIAERGEIGEFEGF